MYTLVHTHTHRRIKGQRDVFDFFGWFASFLEFSVTFWVASENGKLSKETLKGFYDGTFFYQLEQRVAEAKQAKKVRLQFAYCSYFTVCSSLHCACKGVVYDHLRCYRSSEQCQSIYC
jgi:Caleosin related protein